MCLIIILRSCSITIVAVALEMPVTDCVTLFIWEFMLLKAVARSFWLIESVSMVCDTLSSA